MGLRTYAETSAQKYVAHDVRRLEVPRRTTSPRRRLRLTPDQCWLSDAAGELFVGELRMAVDPAPYVPR